MSCENVECDAHDEDMAYSLLTGVNSTYLSFFPLQGIACSTTSDWMIEAQTELHQTVYAPPVPLNNTCSESVLILANLDSWYVNPCSHNNPIEALLEICRPVTNRNIDCNSSQES